MPQTYTVQGPKGPITFDHEPTEAEIDAKIATSGYDRANFSAANMAKTIATTPLDIAQGIQGGVNAIPDVLRAVANGQGPSWGDFGTALSGLPEALVKSYSGLLDDNERARRIEQEPIGTALDLMGVGSVANMARRGLGSLLEGGGKALFKGGFKLGGVGTTGPERRGAEEIARRLELPLSEDAANRASSLMGERSRTAGSIQAQTQRPLTRDVLKKYVDPEAHGQVDAFLRSPGPQAEQAGVSETLQNLAPPPPTPPPARPGAGFIPNPVPAPVVPPPPPDVAGMDVQRVKQFLQKIATSGVYDAAAMGEKGLGRPDLARNMGRGVREFSEKAVTDELGPKMAEAMKKANNEATYLGAVREAGYRASNSVSPEYRAMSTGARLGAAGAVNPAEVANATKTGLAVLLATSPQYATRGGLGVMRAGRAVEAGRMLPFSDAIRMNPQTANMALIQEALRKLAEEKQK